MEAFIFIKFIQIMQKLHITFDNLGNYTEKEIQDAINELGYEDCTFSTLF